MISHDELTDILSYDPKSGEFTWLVTPSGRAKRGDVAGCVSAAGRGRVEIRIKGRLYLAHRLAWFYCHGEWPSQFIDHIDGNPSNNKMENLRIATLAQNNQNRMKKPNSTSVWKGVSWDRQRSMWACQLSEGKKHLHRTYHTDERDAAEEYIFASLKHFGEFTRCY